MNKAGTIFYNIQINIANGILIEFNAKKEEASQSVVYTETDFTKEECNLSNLVVFNDKNEDGFKQIVFKCHGVALTFESNAFSEHETICKYSCQISGFPSIIKIEAKEHNII